ncbi:MAG TPA: 50S ribosomal protein L24 [Candidatus Omnitrophica bacterium]|nr:MAG: 50S ribosomal protein L24 [Candidatus Omnitrophota bacterium]RKY42727.1 MAG: 50S ribosomal protein L24 [Candidatus Omnitrophota bacterium]HEC69084.1 50S ribosomal protein L24 [Candidatus Omnitrophota bacterium]
MAVRIKRGDLVVVRKGKDRGKTGKVLRVFPQGNRALVEGANLVKKHLRRRGENQPSGIVEVPLPINLSNLALWCNNCKRGVRFSIKILEDKTKVRTCKKCGQVL